MANDDFSKPSFSAGLKWRAAFQVCIGVVCVAAVVVMVNYLGSRYFTRFYLSSQTRIELSSRTLNLLHSLTNQVTVTVYFDQDAELFPTIIALLKVYRINSPNISIKTVDYNRDPAEAEKIKAQYGLPSVQYAPGQKIEKNLVIFDCNGQVKIVPGNALADYTLETVPNEKEREFRNRPIRFKGEMMFTSMLLAISNSKPFKAYFLQGHGEPLPTDTNEKNELAFGKFTTVLQQNYIQSEPLTLLGTNTVPFDCNLLIIAGTTEAIPPEELVKVEQFLSEGGRLFVLFNFNSVSHPIGLETTLAKWGVSVGNSTIQDPDNSLKGLDIIVSEFSKHPLVNSLLNSRLHLILPRAIGATDANIQVADAPKVEEVAFTGPRAVEQNNPSAAPRRFPLMVAVEKGAVKGVVTERGTTRLLVVGDSIFLGNHQIESAANRDFAGYAANWLLDRSILLEGVGPRPVTEYRVIMSKKQMKAVQWILLGAMPGAVLLLGGLVWLRRRK